MILCSLLLAVQRGNGVVWRRSVFVLAVVLLGAACGETGSGAIRFGLASAPITFDPRYATDATSTRLIRLLYQRLIEFDDRAQPVASTATWEVLAPTHYRFHLRPGSDPIAGERAMTAADVKATYDSVLDAATASPHRQSLDNIARVDVIDDRTVDFILRAADPIFPGRLVISIMPAELLAAQHPFAEKPVGSGPFVLLARPHETQVLFERRADRQAFEFVTVKDPTVRILKLMRGEVDIVQDDLQPELVQYLARREQGVVIAKARGTRFSYLGFNLADRDTGQRLVRQAIALAIDRPAIVQYVFGGSARLASALLPPDHWAGDPALAQYEYDPAGARAKLAEAGYGPQRPLTLVYKTSSDAFRVRLATILQQQLAQVGVQVELQTFDWGTFYGDIKAGRFQMFSLSWVGIKTPDIFRYAFHSGSVPPVGANRGRMQDAQVDALIARAERAATLDEQAAVYRAVQQRLWEELPYVPLWYEDNVAVSGAAVEGYSVGGDGNYDGLAQVRRRL